MPHLENPIRFWVAGYPPNFFASTFGKDRRRIFEWLRSIGLDWVELQSTYGVKMPREQALEYRALAEKYGIGISVHAPYYISLASSDPAVVARSQDTMIRSFELASWLGSKRVIFHPGFAGKWADRAAWLDRLIRALNEIESSLPLDEWIRLYPEIGGKISALGSLDEIIEICRRVSYATPCLDLAHLHARELGSLFEPSAFARVFARVRSELWDEQMRLLHVHMYPVECNDTGEKMHKAFWDLDPTGKPYGPILEGFIDTIRDENIHPVIICEARDTQDVGAIRMRDYYLAK